MLIDHKYHQPVMIAFDIEDNPVVCQEADIPINRFNISRAIPGSAFHIMKPGLQGNRGIRVFYPELA